MSKQEQVPTMSDEEMAQREKEAAQLLSPEDELDPEKQEMRGRFLESLKRGSIQELKKFLYHRGTDRYDFIDFENPEVMEAAQIGLEYVKENEHKLGLSRTLDFIKMMKEEGIEEENEEEKTERIGDIRAEIKGSGEENSLDSEKTKKAARKWKARRGLR